MAFNIDNLAGSNLNGELTGVIVGAIIFLSIFLVAVYIYAAFAYFKIAKKMKHPRPWLAWIPFANIAMWYELGGFNWKWVFLMILPFFINPVARISIGAIPYLILLTIAHWRVFKKLKYPEWLSLSLVLWLIPWVNFIGYISYFIIIGIVAWRK